MGAKLELALLGPPQIRLAGDPLTGFKTRKAQALLFYLAVTGHAHSRTSLAGLLWGDMPEGSARINLSKSLSELRTQVGDHVVIERSQVAFNLRSNYWLDLNELEAAVDRLHGKRPPQPGLAPRQLTEATKLYRGDLLQGFEVQDAPDFELWMLAERGRQRERMVQILSWLVESSIEQRRWRAGIDAARRLLQIEPWRETAHRQLMLLLARDGQRSAALV